MKIDKAVIVAAGRGTRFLPVTRSIPKEMLPLVNKPLIQYAVEEVVASGIERVVIVTAPGKQSLVDYFSSLPELESFLEERGKAELLGEIQRLGRLADVSYVIQEEPLGLGHAVLTARDAVGDGPFAVLLPDDIIDSRVPVLRQMLDVFGRCQGNILAVRHIGYQETSKYGVIKSREVSPGLYRVEGLVEKPEPGEAPSQLGVVGRYILMPEVFDAISATPPGTGGEIQLTDALGFLLAKQDIYALEFEGVRYDTGTPQGWLEAQIAFAMKDPELSPKLRQYLGRLLQSSHPFRWDAG